MSAARAPRVRTAAAAFLTLALAVTSPAPLAAQRRPAPLQIPAHAALSRRQARLGEPVAYRGWIVVPHAVRARWLPVEPGGALSWGALSARRIPEVPGANSRSVLRDTVAVETSVQAFATGILTVPGLRFEVDEGRGPIVQRLPSLKLAVVGLVAAADSNAELRALRGPLGAPWWERVPWLRVAAGALIVALLIALIRWLRRRRPAPALAPVTPRLRDPAAEALAELAALRRLNLPEQGRFAEHAFQLTRIVRRFLEATAGVARPGHTTTELLAQLESARLTHGTLPRLEALLRLWDRVKFARAASTVEEAHRAESEAEQLVRRSIPAAEPRRVA
jgi:hypothetical protein